MSEKGISSFVSYIFAIVCL